MVKRFAVRNHRRWNVSDHNQRWSNNTPIVNRLNGLTRQSVNAGVVQKDEFIMPMNQIYLKHDEFVRYYSGDKLVQ